MFPRKLFWTFFLIIFICGCGSEKSAGSQDKPLAPIEVSAAVDKAVATTGDVITYTVTINRSPEAEVKIPEFGAEIAGFRIEDYGGEEPREVQGRVIIKRWYKLRADLIGSYIIPPVKLAYRFKAKPAEVKEVQTSQIFVEVKSVIPKGEQVKGIIDIKPLIEPKINYALWALVIGGVVFVLILIIAGIVYYRIGNQTEEVVIKPPAHETALARLNRLKESGYPKPGDMKLTYFDLSEAYRAYLEDRYSFPATEWTSEEIIPQINKNGDLTFDLKHQNRTFLLNTDQVKFAEHIPTEDAFWQEVERAISFVEATKIKETEVSSQESE